jgi:hypothetical protein
MKSTILVLFLILTTTVAMAQSEANLMAIIKNRCDFFNKDISLDIRMDCVTDYVNCAVVGAGEIKPDKATQECLGKKAKERKHEQFQD